MQNVSSAAPEVNVQHLLFAGSVHSDETWQIRTFVVSLQVWPRCVGHAASVVHDVPSDWTLQLGKLPVPFGTSTPQHTGVVPPHSSGPSHVI